MNPFNEAITSANKYMHGTPECTIYDLRAEYTESGIGFYHVDADGRMTTRDNSEPGHRTAWTKVGYRCIKCEDTSKTWFMAKAHLDSDKAAQPLTPAAATSNRRERIERILRQNISHREQRELPGAVRFMADEFEALIEREVKAAAKGGQA
jgi:hypothetical protein